MKMLGIKFLNNFRGCVFRQLRNTDVCNKFSTEVYPRYCTVASPNCLKRNLKDVQLLVPKHEPTRYRGSCLKHLAVTPLLWNESVSVRHYAKKGKKDKPKHSGGKHKSSTVNLTDEDMHGVFDRDEMAEKMAGVVEHLRQEYMQQLVLRTNTAVFETLTISTADGRFPLNQLCRLTMKTPHLLVINLQALPQYMGDVKEALTQSGMNLNPQQDGSSLFVPIPKVTRERREELAKSAKTLCDAAKLKLRDIHNKYLRQVKKSKESEDLLHQLQTLIQQTMHEHASKAEELMKAKQKELLP